VIRVLAIGDWAEGQVHITRTRSSRATVSQLEKIIAHEWTSASQRLGEKLFDGPMCRMESFSATPAALHLAISPTSYRIFLGTNLTHAHLGDELGNGVLANPVGMSCNLLTRDGFLLLGRRNASVAYYPQRVHPFAGCLEPTHATNVFDEARRELREELSLSPDELQDIRCVGMIEDFSLRQPELIFEVHARQTRAQIESGIDDAEHHACVAIANVANNLCDAVRDPAMTPVAVGALALWGRRAFGVQWFDDVAREFGFRFSR
jgi:hypothetical protein